MVTGAKPLILVADDDEKIRGHFEGLLINKGYGVVLASNGREALERVREHSPDLVLLDVIMPGLDGLEVCRILKAGKAASFLPIIILTAKNDVDSRLEGLKLGADDYLSKPADADELLARIDALLRIKKLQDRISATQEKVVDSAVTDNLTGLFNADYLVNRLQDEFHRAEKYSEPLSCIMIHVDKFKTLADTHGHEAKDRVIKDLAGIISEGMREFDIVVRQTDNEFVILLPRTHFTGSLAVASRIWQQVQQHRFIYTDIRLHVEVSMGVSFFPNKDFSSAAELIDQALQALGKAREAGNNQICLYQHTAYFYRPDMGNR